MKVQLLRITEKPIELISQAYRICYASAPKEGDKELEFIAACIKRDHTSPIEHCSVTFLVEGISRPCSQQLERHRIASYTQESQRYVKFDDEAHLLIPDSIEQNCAASRVYTKAVIRCSDAYKDLLAAGIKPEDARFVLPQAVTTKLMFTINFRSLRNLFKLRLDPHAQWEIRELATKIYELLMQAEPRLKYVFGDIYEKFKK